MGQTTIKTTNVNKPAPRWWRKLERAMLIAFIPAAVTIIQGVKFKDELQATKLVLFLNVGVVALIKGTGMILANGEEYTSTEKPDQ
ncbi:hypothetical protein [Flavihumibacter petaseus]|uniref:Uncharacterized protein n=1 Tax=Flavihumibacter petaseus NBRC 106054 TaxID=1220578 RepID=A0A0E9N1Z5_9BACT|nr:hypothetical protein [Flavihumibacter petaseus]GAO43808.1 hypothetical protein FPE01S_02_09140 [Flavihumibacter petaseus NBRC 106054]